MSSPRFQRQWIFVWLGSFLLLIGFFVGSGSERTEKPDNMVLVPAGDFLMGDDRWSPDEKPRRRIFLDAYYIDRYEVTNADYYAFWMADGEKKSAHTPVTYGEQNWPQISLTMPDHPIVGVAFNDAVAYAKWAGKRLPTEAEWEKAARGNDGQIWPWGNTFFTPIGGVTIHANVWYGKDRYGFDTSKVTSAKGEPAKANGTAFVGRYPTGASPYGVLDMAGNVAEWVADWYSETYYYRIPSRSPKGPDSGSWRVVRGGSWVSDAESARTTSRMPQYPTMRTSFVGFRCAKRAESGEKKK